ncbi:NETI motif-containing protein [Halalkalibacter sp. APA_J-10(15)]|uniref:NETI motif-containing protein n=1 Tax=unclassified Halalkalibacter TaxID=2893063 RepID=UPI001FF27D23|nr:NETI motif-containing protein [Halalkalibacter sp. APA_J-10(15)]MCK0472361.1 NETI motif-containing protein [Halalkalibacter sp. APA_J-10(15)]
MTKQRKKKFEVEEGETIEQCLDRMKKEGYQPMRRLEKPIFEERTERTTKEYVPIRQKIVFEGVLTENEQ